MESLDEVTKRAEVTESFGTRPLLADCLWQKGARDELRKRSSRNDNDVFKMQGCKDVTVVVHDKVFKL